MLGKHKFRVGQRVRPSPYGQQRFIFPKTRWNQTGIVEKVDRFNSPTVRWAGRKTTSSYYPDFIEPDRRRKVASASSGKDD
jgi:hypothetical protein